MKSTNHDASAALARLALIAAAVMIALGIATATFLASRPAAADENDQYDLWYVETKSGDNYSNTDQQPVRQAIGKIQSIFLTADRTGYTLNARLNVALPQTIGVLDDFTINLRSTATVNLKREGVVVSASVIAPGGPRKDKSDTDHLAAGSTHRVSIDLPKDYSPDEQGFATIKLASF